MKSNHYKMDGWEQLWAPYDETTYQAVLAVVRPYDTLLDIGAGDLRLTIRMAALAQKVYAIEIQEAVLDQAAARSSPPDNLVVLAGDARTIPFPPGITTGVLLMRHCTHFNLYMKKLRAVGCQRLITNARWGSGVEVVALNTPRLPYNQLEMGWYACQCGAAGFKAGAVERLTAQIASTTVEVIDCPGCRFPRQKRQPKVEDDPPDFGILPKYLDRSDRPITLFQEGARAK